jgi:hypothetical protein
MKDLATASGASGGISHEGIDSGASLRCDRDALYTRVLILEAALACIARESELACADAGTSFVAAQRIGAIVRQALQPADPPIARAQPDAVREESGTYALPVE